MDKTQSKSRASYTMSHTLHVDLSSKTHHPVSWATPASAKPTLCTKCVLHCSESCGGKAEVTPGDRKHRKVSVVVFMLDLLKNIWLFCSCFFAPGELLSKGDLKKMPVKVINDGQREAQSHLTATPPGQCGHHILMMLFCDKVTQKSSAQLQTTLLIIDYQ